VARSMIDVPADLSWAGPLPVDPKKPDELPKLRGTDYRPYIEALAAQRASAAR